MASGGSVEETSAMEPSAMEPPQTRYTRSGDVNIAFQVLGEGPLDLVWIPRAGPPRGARLGNPSAGEVLGPTRLARSPPPSTSAEPACPTESPALQLFAKNTWRARGKSEMARPRFLAQHTFSTRTERRRAAVGGLTTTTRRSQAGRRPSADGRFGHRIQHPFAEALEFSHAQRLKLDPRPGDKVADRSGYHDLAVFGLRRDARTDVDGEP